jgi:FixJ family two-component response regulator
MMSDAMVYVVDDEPEIRDSVAMLLRSVGIGSKTFASGTEFLAAADLEAAGCVIADVRMPGISGLELQENLRAKQVRLPIIIITGHGDVAMAVRAMKAGAADFIEKPFNGQVLLDAVNRALASSRADAGEPAQRVSIDERLATLSAREREVMVLIAEGRPNKVVATRLGLSTRTVETHRANIMQKMGAKSLADLVRMAIASGLLEV